MEPGIRNTAYELTRYLLILLCIGKNFNLDTVDLTLCGCQAGIQGRHLAFTYSRDCYVQHNSD